MVQRDHKYATPPPAKQFLVFLATAPTNVLTAGTAEIRKTKFMGKVLHIYGKRRRCTIAGITVHTLLSPPCCQLGWVVWNHVLNVVLVE